MSCWERTFQWIGLAADLSGLDELYKSLCSDRAMSADALSDLLRQDVPGAKVQTRIAVDGHDVEVQNENGIWTVLRPQDIVRLNRQKIEPLAIEAPAIRIDPLEVFRLRNRERDF